MNKYFPSINNPKTIFSWHILFSRALVEPINICEMKKVIVLAVISIGLLSFVGNKKPSDSKGSYSSKFFLLMKNKNCIDACNECASFCNNCASMCLKDKDVAKMAHCTQLCMECASICTAVAQLMSLDSENAKSVCAEAAKLCDKCATQCDKFTMEYCKECASACRKASKLCKEM